MKLCSIDSSTKKTGIAYFLDGQLTDYKLLDYSSISDSEQRRDEMSIGIINTLSQYDPDIVWIEDSWNALNLQTSKALTMIIGIVYAWCLINKKEFHTVFPSEWRSWLGMDQGKKKRAELKQMAKDYVQNVYHITPSEDECDAICIGSGVCNYFGLLE